MQCVAEKKYNLANNKEAEFIEFVCLCVEPFYNYVAFFMAVS